MKILKFLSDLKFFPSNRKREIAAFDRFVEDIKIDGANLEGADLTKADLTGGGFEGVNLENDCKSKDAK